MITMQTITAVGLIYLIGINLAGFIVDAARLSDSRFNKRSNCFLSATLSSHTAICISTPPKYTR